MQLKEHNLQYYITKLKNKEYFSFTRWGDGEWGCAFGVQGENCDGHKYSNKLREGLLNVIKGNVSYYFATWPKTVPMFSNLGEDIYKTIEQHKIKNLVDARVWEEAAMGDSLQLLIQQISEMNFIMVSEKAKSNLPFITDFIEVPIKNCFDDKERIKRQVIEMFEKYDDVVFGFSASMASNVIIDELFDLIGDKCWMIDFGSIWEPYIGKITRSYHKRYLNTKL